MVNQDNCEAQNCTDGQSGGALLPPAAHDLTMVEQTPELDLDTCGVYLVKRTCTRDGCQGGFTGLKPIGETISGEENYRAIAYELYESYYETPRQISYPTVQALVQTTDQAHKTTITNNLCDAAKLGRLDAEEDRPKRTKQDVVDTALTDNPTH